MRKSERTRQHIIESTAPLFNIKGFDGTSLADLTEATGLTKGALYGHFEDKEEIAREAFRYAVKKVKRIIRDRLASADTAKKQLTLLVEFYAEYVFSPPVKGGCPLLNASIEVDDHRTTMRRAVAAELVLTVDFIASLITKGIRRGEFKKEIRARELAYVLFCSIEGALMFARVERSDEAMKIMVKHCKMLLNQISKQK
jgi:TetR/AcrR family transcriptional regulator, transcriptional repressor for nem operon